MPLNQACLNRTYGPATHTFTEEGVRAYAAATGSPSVPSSPDGTALALPAMAFVPSWPVIQEAIADPDLGNEPGQIIHGEQVMRFHRPIAVGDVLTTTGTVTRIEPKGRNEVYVLSLMSRDESGQAVVEQDNICISLGSAPKNEALDKVSSPKPPSPPEEPPRPLWVAEEVLPADITTHYSQASGDFSEVHLDDEFAKSLGFPGIIVHGMCLLSIAVRPILQKQLGDQLDRLREIRVRFAAPVEPGETIRTGCFESADGYGFSTFVGERKALTAGFVSVDQS